MANLPACPHVAAVLPGLAPPRAGQDVHKDECTLCFDGSQEEHGIDVCLTCFNGGCVGNKDREHARAHASKTWHPIVCNVKRRRKPSENPIQDTPSKVAILARKEEDDWLYETTVKCMACDQVQGRLLEKVGKLGEVANSIVRSLSSSQQNEVQAWEAIIEPCQHTRDLQQEADATKVSNEGKCSRCDLTANLWLCLTCGAVSCGRQQFGGLGGNGHAMLHFKDTGHPVSVKQGTITPEGTADIYCYACDDERKDPDLAKHLQHLGISTLGLVKTEKSMTELNLEQNINFDFNMTGDDGKELQPLFGPGLTGLKNLGNSCYMASVLQAVFALPTFKARYFTAYRPHTTACTNPQPANCIECQMGKLADGLLSGRYAVPSPEQATKNRGKGAVFQDGIKPSMLKSLIGRGHSEFSTMRQQDADEFLKHLVSCLQRDTRRIATDVIQIEGAPSDDATRIFSFGLQSRLQCTECRRVRYTVEAQDTGLSLPVPLRPKFKPPQISEVVESGNDQVVNDVVLPPTPREEVTTDILPDGPDSDAMQTGDTTPVPTPPRSDISGPEGAQEAKGKAPVEGPHAVNELEPDPYAAAQDEASDMQAQSLADEQLAKSLAAEGTKDDPINLIGEANNEEDAESRAKEEAEFQKAIADSLQTGGSLNQIEYEEVDLQECLDIFTAPEELEYHCPACEKHVIATKQTLFTSFPDVLSIQVRRFQLINWVPQKVDVPINVPLEGLNLDKYLGTGRRDDEEELPEPKDDPPPAAASSTPQGSAQPPPSVDLGKWTNWSGPKFDQGLLSEGIEMGMSPGRAQNAYFEAFRQTGRWDASEVAMDWAFSADEDPAVDIAQDFDGVAQQEIAAIYAAAGVDPYAPADVTSNESGGASVAQSGTATPTADYGIFEEMGFSKNQARKALRVSNGNADAAVGWLFENGGDPGEEEQSSAPAYSAFDATAAGPESRTATDVEMIDGSADGVAGPSSTSSAPPPVGGSAALPANFSLKSFISHKGPSIHSGHYVAHIRHDEDAASGSSLGNGPAGEAQWVLFNDEKVVKAPFSSQSSSGAHLEVGVKGLVKLAYVYVFERTPTPAT
ncbi:ubiquitin carboxyl-terminal hydrolase 14 [Ceraceosorus bombacis]|uniref:ubiquitinyl hydrolase 1 n=1 Tax=Ceraceosorus bombacis TaxID=401625 RepID=A0A0P1BC57_9BASI|nr:ubiquitin carboxyl-terminal hydrolase 14 [Ceraceosorus bombacis]